MISSSLFYTISLQFGECGAIAAILALGEIFFHNLWMDCTDLHSTVPTQDQVLVPETLLKKRKSQEQARAVQREEAEKKKAVSTFFFLFFVSVNFCDDKFHHMRLDTVDVVASVNHLSGLMLLVQLFAFFCLPTKFIEGRY